MSTDNGDIDGLDLPAAEDRLASAGAAADSVERDEALKGLPRLIRYAILSNRDNSLACERLVAEIMEVAPALPLATAWAEQRADNLGIALASELDHLSVTGDKPDLRSLADSVRLLCLNVPIGNVFQKDHRRVACALLRAYRELPPDIDIELAAEVEAFSVGWAALPVASDMLWRFHDPSATAAARTVGRKMASHRVEAAEAELTKKFEAERQEWQNGVKPSDQATTPRSIAGLQVAEDHVIVCRLDETAMKNPKMREIIAPLKSIINAELPLVPVPPLHEVRAKLMFEFPYAEDVIDFVLADLVGRRTVRLRPLLICGEPGGGKSRFARRIGETLSVGVWRTDASRSDGAVFGGTDRRWYTAEPCHPFLAIAQTKQSNPIVLLDELEKAGTRNDYGRLWDCLLGFLEPESNVRYFDPALQTPLNLGFVSYVATANVIDPLPMALRDRFRIITFPKPGPGDLGALLPAVIADLAAERGLDSRWVEPLAGFERDAVAAHWRGGSVRRLRRVVEIVLRIREKAAARN